MGGGVYKSGWFFPCLLQSPFYTGGGGTRTTIKQASCLRKARRLSPSPTHSCSAPVCFKLECFAGRRRPRTHSHKRRPALHCVRPVCLSQKRLVGGGGARAQLSPPPSQHRFPPPSLSLPLPLLSGRRTRHHRQ